MDTIKDDGLTSALPVSVSAGVDPRPGDGLGRAVKALGKTTDRLLGSKPRFRIAGDVKKPFTFPAPNYTSEPSSKWQPQDSRSALLGSFAPPIPFSRSIALNGGYRFGISQGSGGIPGKSAPVTPKGFYVSGKRWRLGPSMPAPGLAG